MERKLLIKIFFQVPKKRGGDPKMLRNEKNHNCLIVRQFIGMHD